jgi:ATP-dependent helicase HrpA
VRRAASHRAGRRAGLPARRARDPRGRRGAAQAPSRRGTEILPLFARLSAEEQSRIFKPHVGRRIVLATNVAETSLTVPGIRYVVDTGLARVKRYSYRNKVEQLQIEKIAQASANQRAGRCGRVAAGVCIRLYDEEDFARARRTPIRRSCARRWPASSCA